MVVAAACFATAWMLLSVLVRVLLGVLVRLPEVLVWRCSRGAGQGAVE